MADKPESLERGRISPKPPEHAHTRDPIAVRATSAGTRPAVSSPLSHAAGVDDGGRRRRQSFLGAAASPPVLRSDVSRGSLESIRGDTNVANEGESHALGETTFKSEKPPPPRGEPPLPRPIRGSIVGRPRRAGTLKQAYLDSKEGLSTSEQGLEDGTGGETQSKQPRRIRRRRVFTRADPKSFFSNERTMYSWMWLNVLTLSYSLSLYAYPQLAGDHPPTNFAATFASAAALILVFCSSIRFSLRQDRLACTENWISKLFRRRPWARRNTNPIRETGNELARLADVFDSPVSGYPLMVALLLIMVLVTNLVCIYRIPLYEPRRSRAFTA